MRRVSQRASLVLSLLAASVLWASAAPSTASAQTLLSGNGLSSGGMDLQLFRPAMDSKGYLSVNGTDILGHLDFSFGLIVNGGFGLIPFNGFHNDSTVTAAAAARCPSGVFCGRAVDYVFSGILHANLGLANLLEVGLQIPIGFSSGPNLTIPGILNDYDLGAEGGRAGNGIGYQELRILRAERNGGFGLGVGLQVEFPTAASRSSSSATRTSWSAAAQASRRAASRRRTSAAAGRLHL
jgi:OOP family OmpA-OmpF porin